MSLWLCSFGSWLCSCCLPLCPGIPSGKMGIFLAILLFVFSVMSLWWCCIDGEVFSCRSLPAVVQKLIQPKESCLLITLSSAVHPVNIWWIWKVGTTINSAYHSCYNYCGCYCQFMLLLLLCHFWSLHVLLILLFAFVIVSHTLYDSICSERNHTIGTYYFMVYALLLHT